MNKERFIFDWVLINKLAVGSKPTDSNDILFLEENGIRSILNLCYEEEAPFVDSSKLKIIRYSLPDHKYKNIVTIQQINDALNYVEELF